MAEEPPLPEEELLPEEPEVLPKFEPNNRVIGRLYQGIEGAAMRYCKCSNLFDNSRTYCPHCKTLNPGVDECPTCGGPIETVD